jgi:hypothetical protein
MKRADAIISILINKSCLSYKQPPNFRSRNLALEFIASNYYGAIEETLRAGCSARD